MIFAHDPQMDFYYYGEEQPGHGFLRDKLFDNPPQVVAVDTETISLKERIAIGVSIATSSTCCFYFPLFPEPSQATPWRILQDPKYMKIYHNSIFDLTCLREYEVDATNVRDTNIMARLSGYKDCDLLSMSIVHGMEVHNAGDVLKENHVKTMLELDKDTVAKKCMQDSMATLQLYHRLLPKVDLAYLSMEMQTIPIMEKMSARGILIDQEFRGMLEEILEDEVAWFRNYTHESEGFNPGSSQQVSYILAKRGAYRVFTKLPYTKGRKLSSAKEVLEKMDDPMAALVLNYRQKATLLADFVLPWKGSERAYTRFHLDATTGRPSSTQRNMQNIPGKPNEPNPRNMFLPDSPIFTDWDFSQLELRILAHLSGDREMQYIFSLPAYNLDGSRNLEADIHQQTANFLGIPRRISKNVNFAMVYGGTDDTLAETANIRDIRRARQLRDMWFAKYPQAGDWIQGMQGLVYEDPYATTLYGRRIRLDLESDEISSMQRKAINYPIQASAAEILKRSLIVCKDFDLSLQVHDQLLIDGYAEEQWLKDRLEHLSPLYTPIEVRYETRWE